MASAKEAISAAEQRLATARFGLNDMTGHGFRSIFSTLLNAEIDDDDRQIWDKDAVELQLAHLDHASTRAIYNRTGSLSLIGQRTKMMQHWADRVDTMAGENVVAIGKHRNVA
jgi:integrase